MSPVWVLPVLVLTVGGVAVAALGRAAAESARALAAEAARLAEVREPLAGLGRELETLGDGVSRLRR